MKDFELKKLQKKGSSGVNATMTFLLGGLVIVVAAVELAPTMFAGISGLENESSVPAWVPTLLFIIVGIGIVFLIWRAFGNK